MGGPEPDCRSEERLVAAVLEGDDGAFAVLVERHKRRVLRIAARFSRTPQDLEELGQEIFLKAYQGLRRYRGDAPLEHWLSRIAVRSCYDALRKRLRQFETVPFDEQAPYLADRPSDEAERSGAMEARALLDGALSRLRPAERLVITLLELEERTVREVAGLTGWSEVNVKVRAFRARKALKRILEDADDGKR